VRLAYVIAGIVVFILGLFNVPRLPWLPWQEFGPAGIFRGLADGAIGFSYHIAWGLALAGVYQLLLGLLYWDMDLREVDRWQLKLDTGLTGRLLWITGAACLLAGIGYLIYTYTHDSQVWPCGIASTVWAWLACYLTWMGFPLMEQVGFDRNNLER
jgi:hypothetical protein